MRKSVNHTMQYFLFIGMLLPAASPALAQQFNAGVFGGITASQVTGDSYAGYNKLGLTTGVFVNREIDYNIYWQLEIKYVSRGVYKGPSDLDQTLYRSTYRYIELPLSVHYLYDEKIQVEAGTSPEVLISTTFSDQDGIIDPDNYPDNRRIGLSVFAGLHYWFNSTTGVGIRFTYSAIPFR
ncbi:MAG: outer membrane beta-barrel protein, partial [Bacteroidales bacterium]|nr:outer membrane beta-barrel protein [Bacteroidales bacterium]